MLRLFVGLDLPEDVRRRLAIVQAGLPGARWVAPESLHLTVRFIGEVDEARAEDIARCLETIRHPGFAFAFAGLGHFGHGRTVRAVWAGVEAGPDLDHLRRSVDSAVVRAGEPPEGRRFTPHVVLARFKANPGPRLGAWLEANNPFRAGPVTVSDFVLFRSHLGSEGAHYEVLARFPLGGVV